jgi:hypothetical protein
MHADRTTLPIRTNDHAAAGSMSAPARMGGAMNSGPTGSVMRVRKMPSISALALASSVHPPTDPTGES